MDNFNYWNNLVSMGLRVLQEKNMQDSVFVIKNSKLNIELNNSVANDRFKYWDIEFHLKYKDYKKIEDKKDTIESELSIVLEELHNNTSNFIANVLVIPAIEKYIDWLAVLPDTKESTIKLIQDEKEMLLKVSTGQLSFNGEGVEEKYQDVHSKILTIAKNAGFDYPVSSTSLEDWWYKIKDIPHYQDRRTYIRDLFNPLLELLQNSEEDSLNINFQSIASISDTISKSLNSAELLIRNSQYDLAVDRIHTAFHGYLKSLLKEHNTDFQEGANLPSLFSKYYDQVELQVKPDDVGRRIKMILRSASGMINSINEIRNNNTIAHPNEQLIQKREALLVIELVNALVKYIEDIEKTINK